MTADLANWEATKTGKVRAVCEWCGRRSSPVFPCNDGRPALFDLGRGWSVAPYPIGYQHADGSRGPRYTCPACARVRDERQLAGIRPLLSPTPERAAARVAGSL
jgi:hypothetical protein